ncbi:hypothetical protein ThvES_00018250 [Thiovulum sp. ES]|nr:hypothetical protein ThvES_00018250 [Thiovulum sp. ES]
MKKFSSPQVIILLDFIFVFLLILITQKPSEIKINLPQNRLSDTEIVIAKDGHVSHFWNSGNWIKISNYKNSNFKFSSGYAIDVECNSLCDEVSNLNGHGEKRILITGYLYSQISNVLLGACKHNSSACSNIEIDINENGGIDYELLKKKNPIFKDIL